MRLRAQRPLLYWLSLYKNKVPSEYWKMWAKPFLRLCKPWVNSHKKKKGKEEGIMGKSALGSGEGDSLWEYSVLFWL